MREIVHLQAGQCGNQIGAKVSPERPPTQLCWGLSGLWPLILKIMSVKSLVKVISPRLPHLFITWNVQPWHSYCWTLHSFLIIIHRLMFLVLGDHLWWARHRPHWLLCWDLWAPAGEDQRLLQWGHRREVRAQGRPGRSGARHHGLRQVRTLRSDLQARQLRVRPVRGREQLGQGTLHRGWVLLGDLLMSFYCLPRCLCTGIDQTINSCHFIVSCSVV